MEYITRDKAFELLKKYNKDPFHIRHAITVEAVMKWYASDLGYPDEAEYWGIVGLLHDIDFEKYPDQHCIKAPDLLQEAGVGEDIIHSVCSHGYGITVDIKPEHEKDMELKSLKKKYKSKGFAAGCNRDIIEKGSEMLGWDLTVLLEKTLKAMQESENSINAQMELI